MSNFSSFPHVSHLKVNLYQPLVWNKCELQTENAVTKIGSIIIFYYGLCWSISFHWISNRFWVLQNTARNLYFRFTRRNIYSTQKFPATEVFFFGGSLASLRVASVGNEPHATQSGQKSCSQRSDTDNKNRSRSLWALQHLPFKGQSCCSENFLYNTRSARRRPNLFYVTMVDTNIHDHSLTLTFHMS